MLQNEASSPPPPDPSFPKLPPDTATDPATIVKPYLVIKRLDFTTVNLAIVRQEFVYLWNYGLVSVQIEFNTGVDMIHAFLLPFCIKPCFESVQPS